MKSRATILFLAAAALLLILAAGVLSVFLLDFGIRDKGRKLPAELPRGSKAQRSTTPTMHEIIEVGRESPHAPTSRTGTTSRTRLRPSDAVTRTGTAPEPGTVQHADFGAPLLSVACERCINYGNEITERPRFSAPAIHDITLVKDGVIFRLFPARISEQSTNAMETLQPGGDLLPHDAETESTAGEFSGDGGATE